MVCKPQYDCEGGRASAWGGGGSSPLECILFFFSFTLRMYCIVHGCRLTWSAFVGFGSGSSSTMYHIKLRVVCVLCTLMYGLKRAQFHLAALFAATP